MALAEEKRPKKIYEKRDTTDKRYISSAKETEASASYVSGDHIRDNEIFDITKPLLYQMQLLEEDIDELRRYTTSSITTTNITSSGNISASSDITANAISSSANIKFGSITMYYDAARRQVVFTEGSRTGTVDLR